MQISLAALPLALLCLGACTAPLVVPSPAPVVPSPAPVVPSPAPVVPSPPAPGGSGSPVAPHAEDPSIGPDPTVVPPLDQSDSSPIAPNIELATPGPDPTVPAGEGVDGARYR